MKQDYEKAVIWYQKAAEQGDMHAQFNLGLCYLKGLGVHIDKKRAENWFKSSEMNGNEKATQVLRELF